MRLLILNGPNINMLGVRDENIYGNTSYKKLIKDLKKYSKENKIKTHFFFSNEEGKIINYIQKNRNKFDGCIINLGAYTHYSYAIADVLDLVSFPIVEVHVSDIYKREDFRKFSVVENKAKYRIIGKGVKGYFDAVDYFLKGDSNE